MEQIKTKLTFSSLWLFLAFSWWKLFLELDKLPEFLAAVPRLAWMTAPASGGPSTVRWTAAGWQTPALTRPTPARGARLGKKHAVSCDAYKLITFHLQATILLIYMHRVIVSKILSFTPLTIFLNRMSFISVIIAHKRFLSSKSGFTTQRWIFFSNMH